MGREEGEGQGDECDIDPCAPVFPSGNPQAASLEMASPLVSLSSELNASSSLNSSSHRGFKEPLQMVLQVACPWCQEGDSVPVAGTVRPSGMTS